MQRKANRQQGKIAKLAKMWDFTEFTDVILENYSNHTEGVRQGGDGSLRSLDELIHEDGDIPSKENDINIKE